MSMMYFGIISLIITLHVYFSILATIAILLRIITTQQIIKDLLVCTIVSQNRYLKYQTDNFIITTTSSQSKYFFPLKNSIFI